ncbi:MAG TPA: flagellar filament capping protein FliD [Acidimicrobiales bacterium]|nr:flagellar filament capping protein FliD [Acidimicrobiales bacterium]
MSMVSSSSSSLPAISFQGIESNLPTQQIIQALLQQYEAPLRALQQAQSQNETKISDYQAIEADLGALESAAQAIAAPDAFASALSASSSDPAVASATLGTGASPGSVSFVVDQLAAADTLVSAGTVAATGDVVASGDLLVGRGGSGIGITAFSGSGLALGSHSIEVTQASAGASVSGASPLAASTTISSSNDALSLVVDGTTRNYTIAAGTYTASQLAAAVTQATGGTVTASVDAAGDLVLTTADQGSQATLQVASASANAALGLATGASGTGTDGIVNVDGTANTVSFISGAGTTTATLTSGTGGTISATLAAGGLSLGSMSAANVSVGNGSLQSVVSAINGAGLGISASALQVGTNAYALELASQATGQANDVTIDPNAFAASSLGALTTTTAGADALVRIGGATGYEVTSPTNTLGGLLPGVSIDLVATSQAPVTVSVSPDGSVAASKVQALVDAANKVLADIATDTAYDPTTNTAAPLNGDGSLELLAQQILGYFGAAIGSSPAADAGSAGSAAGLTLASGGTIGFDPTTFAADFAADPTGVAAMFTQGGTFAPSPPASTGDVSLVYAGNATAPGTYPLVVTHSATQASATGTAVFASSSSTLAGGETYTITMGSSVVQYAIGAGETLSQVASGLDAAFAASGLALSAQVVPNGSGSSLQVTSQLYGSSQSFTVAVSGTDELGLAAGSPYAGTDVAGTIGGVAATGDGQVLAAPVSDPTLAGLSLLVTTPGITSSTPIGSFTYAPGLAQQVASLSAASVAEPGGLLPAEVSGLEATDAGLASQITLQQQLVDQQQAALVQEFNSLEATLASLRAQGAYLANALGGTSFGSLGSATTSTSSSGG